MIEHEPLLPLAEDTDLNPLFRAWLAGDDRLGAAVGDWRRFVGAGGEQAGSVSGESAAGGDDRRRTDGGEDVAPAWRDEAWLQNWSRRMNDDLPDDGSRERLAATVQELAAGRAEVVITGQQPGFLGGPLYTIYKVAAAVAAARARTAAGRPTVPLFWMAEDDDDRQEAFAPFLYDPKRRSLLRGATPVGAADRMIGTAAAAQWGDGEMAWLQEQQGRNRRAADLVSIWREAIDSGRTWGALHRRAILALFGRAGLLVVSGNDSGLHALAHPIYARIWQDRGRITKVAAESGALLEAADFHAQIGATSLQRFLHLASDDRRLSLPHDEQSLPEAGRLRPGVAVRSPVQDWLFRPAAVVVGPGELAYLKQIEPVYELLGVRRCPLLPRLFARLTTRADAGRLQRDSNGEREGSMAPYARIREAVSGAGGAAVEALTAALKDESWVAADRLADLAARQAARWEKGAVIALRKEWEHNRNRGRGQVGAWEQPGGQRQERQLASYWATALWGDELIEATLVAAAAHFAEGAQQRWREFQLIVPEP